MNKGRETLPFLTYVIDHYDKLPDLSFFIHGLNEQWHHDVLPTMAGMLPRLRIQHLLEAGYTNLRCEHDSGCYPLVKHLWPKSDEAQIRQDTALGELEVEYRMNIATNYMGILNITDLNEVPDEIANICCAQFVVNRETILKRPLSDYQRMSDWVMASHLIDHEIGWIFEKLWHIIFQAPPIQYD